MHPDVWGRFLWYSIHFVALDYPENPSPQDRAKYKSFFENLGAVIPCYKCSVNYKRHLEELPLVSDGADFLENRGSLFAWTVELHNIVNKELGKPVVSLDDAFAMYTKDNFQDSRCNIGNVQKPQITTQLPEPSTSSKNQSNNHYMYLGFILLVSVIVILFTVAIMRSSSVKPRKIR